MMKYLLKASLGTTFACLIAGPALAQSSDKVDWTGAYVGGSLGYSWQAKDDNETIRFDTNRDGTFGDRVSTIGGADAFGFGFCSGAALGNTRASGCEKDSDGTTWAIHAGYDRQFGNIVAGIVAEGGKTNIVNSVSAYSVTPASYTMTRELDSNFALRARLGYTTDRGTLFYATGGGAYGKVKNSFTKINNNANTFTQTKTKEDAWGWVAGGGVEQKIGTNFSVGMLYKYARLDAGDYRVNVSQGTALATNPFIITPAGSTDFARSNRFANHSVQATASFRF